MAPTTEPLTAERILEATEEVLRRHGPAKATVVDVARALGVSHGTVYRHFPTKAALREAVTRRWLDHTATRLAEIVSGPGTPEQRLRTWLKTLFDLKRAKACGDPELFATYSVLTDETGTPVGEHIEILLAQLASLIDAGTASGTPDPTVTARAVFQATARFHDPYYALHWQRPGIEDEFNAVLDLLLRGLNPTPPTH
ncbi:TetR family transcriptional regulator [Streptomyces sp. J2-1]|uniref:TetR family transcriptional regulator n=1 Tax=Streptomyces corallincola TaxID=2851888 RepID=UPI001C38C666|nr:TetR family transcriptional regulator [Streptomyces corallincola]MBV2357526.1 TetR family transcriptional regulator [Streptomyces corallincola]